MADQGFMLTMDILVLISLGISIFYMFLLTKGIKKIRNNRDELKKVLMELNITIERADAAVKGLQATADMKAKALQKSIDQAKQSIDELNTINQASENLAKRIEKGALGQKMTQDEPAKKPSVKQMSKAERELAAAMAKKEQRG